MLFKPHQNYPLILVANLTSTESVKKMWTVDNLQLYALKSEHYFQSHKKLKTH